MTITTEQLADHLGITIAPDTGDARWSASVVDAVNAWVATLPVIADRDDPAAPWPTTVDTGAVMLAAHIFHSRSAPYGRATLDVTGGFQQAYADPEVARLLRLRRHARPVIG